ncbi:MAG: ATP synthase subunit delta [Planctomycetota bacterium]|nr:MAG: ATP synthase subunit delta [Planctomycetota bacterium]
MAGEITLSKRYARALLELGTDPEEVARVGRELFELAELYERAPELRTLLATPRTSRQKKKELLARLLGERVAKRTLHFLYLLVDKGRVPLLREIARQYDELHDAARGIARARVRTYLPLTEAQRAQLVERLKRVSERGHIELVEEVDPGLLGGIVVEIGSYVLDGSVRGRLRKLRDHLLLREEQRAQRAAAVGAQMAARAAAARR